MKKGIGFAFTIGFLFVLSAQAVVIDWVTVGNAGNSDGGDGYGGVDYVYKIGKYEVTNKQYCEFLNNVARLGDPYGLYYGDGVLTGMAGTYGGIMRTGSGTEQSPYNYSVKNTGQPDDWSNKPVNYASWYDSIRFTNWLQSGNTENGTYLITSGGYEQGNVTIPLHSTFDTPHFVLPSEDEWFKAAYYDPELGGGKGGYWAYATMSDVVPKSEVPPGTDFVKGSANYENAVGNITEVGAYNGKPSASAYGTFDQNGNLWEWNETLVGSWYRTRGGSWDSAGYGLHREYPASRAAGENSSNQGFRVALVPEPGTFLLLGLGGLVLLRKRR
jgi:formylglycine-generating enzyme required for sulfatase activity